MRIKFFCKIEGCNSIENVVALSGVEQIGFDEMASAHVSYDAQYQSVTWETAWSRFEYFIKPFGEVFEVTYKGALNGFLSQNLIPTFIEVRIEEMEGKIGKTYNLAGRELEVYKHFHGPAISLLSEYIHSLLPERAAQSFMTLSSQEMGDQLLEAAGLVRLEISGWSAHSTCCKTTIYRGYVTAKIAQEWEKKQEEMVEVVDYNFPDMTERSHAQNILWSWIEGVAPQKIENEKVRILKVSSHKRGFGSMTAAIFKVLGGWDYIEVVYPNNSEYQRDQIGLDDEDANSLVGKTIREIKNEGKFHILCGHFHSYKFNDEGNITSLIC